MSRSPEISAILKILETRFETHQTDLRDFQNCRNSRDSRRTGKSRDFQKISGSRVSPNKTRSWNCNDQTQRLRILTFLERGSLVFLQPLHRDRFQPDPGRRIFLENVPHVLLAEDEQVRVAHRSHAGCSSVTCVNVAIYWLSGCVKLSFASGRERSIVPIVPFIVRRSCKPASHVA